MSAGGPTVSERFQARVVAHLEPLTDQLIPVLRRLVEYPYPPEVECLDFEVFCDGFTEGFPVRVFFMDHRNCEFFINRGGRAQYPCDVDPRLLALDRVYGREFEAQFEAEDPGLDYFTLAGEALIPWFSRCWASAGGTRFGRRAEIGLHDGSRRLDLVRQRWSD